MSGCAKIHNNRLHGDAPTPTRNITFLCACFCFFLRSHVRAQPERRVVQRSMMAQKTWFLCRKCILGVPKNSITKILYNSSYNRDTKNYYRTQIESRGRAFRIHRELWPITPLAAVSRSHDIQQMNKTEIVRKQLEIRGKLQRNIIGKPGSMYQNPSWTLT